MDLDIQVWVTIIGSLFIPLMAICLIAWATSNSRLKGWGEAYAWAGLALFMVIMKYGVVPLFD